MTRLSPCLLLALSLAASACSNPRVAATQEQAAAAKPIAASPKMTEVLPADHTLPQAEGWHTIEVKEENYEVTLEWPHSSPNGQMSEMRVGIIPLAPWHMNMEYPMSLSFEEHPDVDLVKLELDSKDAVQHTEQGTGFEVSYTPRKSGTTAVRGKLKFAVCAAEQCMPMNVPVQLDLSVGAV